jgi:hypothetical protein
MNHYNQFIFESYIFDETNKTVSLNYSLDGELQFTETFRFNFDFAEYDRAVLDQALQLLFFMAGVSYYKTFIPPEIVIKQGDLDPAMAHFFSKTYQRGLGEFWFVNKLDPRTPIAFPTTIPAAVATTSSAPGSGLLVGIGGGKDSLVSVELLRPRVQNLATWSVDHQAQLTPLIERIGTPHYWVERTWDRKLLDLAKKGALNGHIPISGIFACVGVVAAILGGKRDVVVSNEQSANEPDFTYQGVEINHQYSKSQEFEADFQKLLLHVFGDQVRYYSFLRPLSEMHIAELFARSGYETYRDVFSSCNRAFIHTSDHMSWCGTCPKCAFVYLVLSSFIPEDELTPLWNGKNLLLDPALEPLYRQLLGIEGGKPLDCVGEIKESRSAMRLAQAHYPELIERYQFELPDDYDYRALAGHHMPAQMYAYLTAGLASFGEPRE